MYINFYLHQLSAFLPYFLQAEDDSFDLRLLLNMTDILAACADGENLFIESVCQTVFSVGEILEILSDPGMSPERKRPFARFLVSVYMNTGGDKNQSGAADLEESRYVGITKQPHVNFLSSFLSGEACVPANPSSSSDNNLS